MSVSSAKTPSSSCPTVLRRPFVSPLPIPLLLSAGVSPPPPAYVTQQFRFFAQYSVKISKFIPPASRRSSRDPRRSLPSPRICRLRTPCTSFIACNLDAPSAPPFITRICVPQPTLQPFRRLQHRCQIRSNLERPTTRQLQCCPDEGQSRVARLALTANETDRCHPRHTQRLPDWPRVEGQPRCPDSDVGRGEVATRSRRGRVACGRERSVFGRLLRLTAAIAASFGRLFLRQRTSFCGYLVRPVLLQP